MEFQIKAGKRKWNSKAKGFGLSVRKTRGTSKQTTSPWDPNSKPQTWAWVGGASIDTSKNRTRRYFGSSYKINVEY